MNIRLMLIRLFLRITKAYIFYEWHLINQLDPNKMPNHIGIIIDGNRRWAKKKSVGSKLTYQIGGERVELMLHWCLDIGIKSITLYILSAENLGRNGKELQDLFDVIEKRLWKLYHDEILHNNKIRVKAIGELEILPHKIKSIIMKLEEKTIQYSNHYLNIAIAYGGRLEMIGCIRKIAEKVFNGEITPSEIDERLIERFLYTCHLPDPDPDLILRTSGEERLSGFLIWQSAYSELVFLDTMWPEFRRIDFLRAIRSYQTRQRRYGL